MQIYLKDSGEVSVHWSFRKLWCYTVVHFDLRDKNNSVITENRPLTTLSALLITVSETSIKTAYACRRDCQINLLLTDLVSGRIILSHFNPYVVK